MTRIDRLALLLSLLAVAAAVVVSARVYEGMAHLEDEMAYVWQSQAITRGVIQVPSPPACEKCFLVPFVVDYQGMRFGKYPLGWPVVLAFGELAGARDLVNPLLSGLTAWFIYRLAKKVIDERTALLAVALYVISPFVLLNAGSLLSSTWSLLLAVVFSIAWLDAFTQPNPALPARYNRILPALTAGLALGLLALTRPLTAVGIAIPFLFHGLYLLLRGDPQARLRVLGVGLLAGGIAALHLLWQYALTGDPLLNPYTLWWPYDQIGFGPDVGLQNGGYQPKHARAHIQFSLRVGSSDLFGWPRLSYLFLVPGLLATWKAKRAWLIGAAAVTLVASYGLYWIGSWVYGPRYYYEGLAGPLLLTAAGIRWLGGGSVGPLSAPRWSNLTRARFALVALVVMLLTAGNLIYYLPNRLGDMHGYARISADCLTPFSRPEVQASTPALVFVEVQVKYNEYGCLLDLTNPFLDSDYVPAIKLSQKSVNEIIRKFPERNVLYYYPDTRRFYETPRDQPSR